MKFGFVTCVQLGLSCIESIYDVGGELDVVITLNDSQATNKSGRIYLDDFCSRHNIPLHKSSHINNDDCISIIKKHQLDWLFIIGWSQIANKELLAAPKHGCIGMHPTLLPVGRGRAAIPWAIIKELKFTGVTMFMMDHDVDTGPILEQMQIPISAAESASSLYEKVDGAHVNLMKAAFPKLLDGSVNIRQQDESRATIWPERKPQDGEIDLNGSVYDAERLVRAVTHPYPGAYFINDGVKTTVWKAELGRSEKSSTYIEFSDGLLTLVEFEVEVLS